MAHEKKTRFLIDENISPLTADQLKHMGYDVIQISRLKRIKRSDAAITQYAAQNNMIIVTLDKDFARIYHLTMRGKVGILLVRVKPPTVENINNSLRKFLKKVDLSDQRFRKVLFVIYGERYKISK